MDIWNESTFPEGTLNGNAWNALRYHSSGEQSDWILGDLGIPSICPEMGSSDYFSYQYIIPFRKTMISVLEENINWLENTYLKINNQVEVEPIGYMKLDQDKALLFFNVSNTGLSDAHNLSVKLNETKVLSENQNNDFMVNMKKRSA